MNTPHNMTEVIKPLPTLMPVISPFGYLHLHLLLSYLLSSYNKSHALSEHQTQQLRVPKEGTEANIPLRSAMKDSCELAILKQTGLAVCQWGVFACIRQTLNSYLCVFTFHCRSVFSLCFIVL